MPKKEKDKKQGQAAKKAEADPLPQVWLPDQVNVYFIAMEAEVGGA